MSTSRMPADSLFHAPAFAAAPLALFTVGTDSVVSSSNPAFARLCDWDTPPKRLVCALPSYAHLCEVVRNGPALVTLGFQAEGVSPRQYSALIWSAPREESAATLHGIALQGDSQSHADTLRALRAELAFMTKVSGTIAHDLNNLLTVIMSVGELMLLQRELSPSLMQRTQTLMAATLRAACLSTQLAQLTHHPKALPARAPAEKLALSVVELLRQLAPELPLQTRISSDPCPLRLDLEPLAQILAQLVLHLRDSLLPESCVLLSMRPVVLEKTLPQVLDAGPYVEFTLASSEDADSQPPGLALTLLEQTDVPVGHRSGLGLTSAQDIIAHVGGHVGLLFRDKAPPLFVVYLPQDPD